MNKVGKICAVLAGFLCLTLPAAAQKEKGLAKAVETVVTRQAAKQTVKKVPYSPIFGYTNFCYKPSRNSCITTTLKKGHEVGLSTVYTPAGAPAFEVQTAPILNYKEAWRYFEKVDFLDERLLAQAIYLRRLANPAAPLDENLKKRAQDLIDRAEKDHYSPARTAPEVRFMKRLLDPTFTPKTYTQLAKETKEYPRHIAGVWERHLFDFSYERAEAQLLDDYLDIAELFQLTKEEKSAVAKLRALRQENYKLSEKPTTRKAVLFLYENLAASGMLDVKNVNIIKDPEPLFVLHEERTKLRKTMYNAGEISAPYNATLVVLSSIYDVWGDSSTYYAGASVVLNAFEYLCRTTMYVEGNVEHLRLLQKLLFKSPVFKQIVSASGEPINYYVYKGYWENVKNYKDRGYKKIMTEEEFYEVQNRALKLMKADVRTMMDHE